MRYPVTVRGHFIRRPNRFIAQVEVEGREETVHVKNTGRCRELLLPGVEVVLAEGANPARKTRYDLVAVDKRGLGWVNIDSQAPNAVVREWLESPDAERFFPGITLIHPEHAFGDSRVDFYLEQGAGHPTLLEVKGCTLEIDGQGYFPDAPTLRGVKHLRELAGAVSRGFQCCVAFVIAMPRVTVVHPNVATHAEFGTALDEAMDAGVKVLYLPCQVHPDSLAVDGASAAFATKG